MAALNFGGLQETHTQALHAKSLHLSECRICIFCPITLVISMLHVSMVKKKSVGVYFVSSEFQIGENYIQHSKSYPKVGFISI